MPRFRRQFTRSRDKSTKDKWDKLQAGSHVVAVLLTPIVLAVIGYSIQLALRQRETEVEMLKLAVEILQEAPKDDEIDLRAWAADVVDANSSIRLPASVKKSLETSRLPVRGRPECDDGVDNDLDRKIDYPADPGCSSRIDRTEDDSQGTRRPECVDGVDNDGDELIDYPNDPDCLNFHDDRERP